MDEKVEISTTILRRLPQYLRILNKAKENKVSSVSSTMLAEELKLNSILVRKDLALVSRNQGKPGVGFDVDELIEDIEKYINIKSIKNAIIIGAGRLGQALLNYYGFEPNMNIVMAFDTNKKVCDNKRIFYIDQLEQKVKENNIDIAIITVPKEEAQAVTEEVVNCGIKAIWNFAPANLKVPEGTLIKNEDLSTSLLILLKKIEDNEN